MAIPINPSIQDVIDKAVRQTTGVDHLYRQVDWGEVARRMTPSQWVPTLPDRLPEPPTDEPGEPQAELDRALDRLSRLEVAVAPVIAVFREYLADSFLPDDARVLMDELPLAGLSHGDLRELMAVWDAGEDEGAAA